MYTQLFAFDKLPFGASTEPSFFYGGASHGKVLEQLAEAIKQNKAEIMVLGGKAGSGKTAILHQLEDQSNANERILIFNHTFLPFESLISYMLNAFGLEVKKTTFNQKIRSLCAHLEKSTKDGTKFRLFIDEAQDLAPEALEDLCEVLYLLRLKMPETILLPVVLSGRLELEKNLKLPQLAQLREAIALSCQTAPLKETEIPDYLGYRISKAGGKLEAVFTENSIKLISRYSKGIPRQIHTLCDNALYQAFLASQKPVTSKMVEEAHGQLSLNPEPFQQNDSNSLK